MIKVIAKIFPKEEQINNVIELLKELVKASVKENGCISYELYQDEEDPGTLIIVEEWESIDILHLHFDTEHFKDIIPQIGKLTAKESQRNICKKII